MGFKLYRYETDQDGNEIYSEPQKAILSGIKGPIASYVSMVKPSVWVLNEMELIALLKSDAQHGQSAILFEAGSDQPGHVTVYRLSSLHGQSTGDSTEIVAYFKVLISNQLVDDLKAFRSRFTIKANPNRPDMYENLKLCGGTSGGAWRWVEVEQILNATVLSPNIIR